MKTLSMTNHVSIAFGKWFSKGGTSYFDADIRIDGEYYQAEYRTGSHAGSNKSIDEVLEAIGFKLRNNQYDRFKPYRAIHTYTHQKQFKSLNRITIPRIPF